MHARGPREGTPRGRPRCPAAPTPTAGCTRRITNRQFTRWCTRQGCDTSLPAPEHLPRLARREGGAVAERAERVEFVPLSLDPAEVSWVAPGRSLAALRAGRS